MLNVGGEQDGAGAGAEGGGGANPGLEDFEEAIALEEFEHGGGFAAGHDEAGDSIEVLRGADEAWSCAERDEDFAVRVIGALEGEDAYPKDGLFPLSGRERSVPGGAGFASFAHE